MAKEYYQKKLTAGSGISIDQNNVISTDSSGAYMTSMNPAGMGKLSMNRADDPTPPAFSSTVAYESGDEVTYEDTPYRALQDMAAGAFDASKWIQINYQGVFSSTLGYQNIAEGRSQSVRGQYNEPSPDFVDIVGYGTSENNRANIQTLDSSGNLWVAGKVTAGASPTSSNDLITKGWAESTLAGEISSSGLSEPTTAQGQNGYTYAKYHIDSSTSAIVVDSLYQKINSEWVEIHVGGGSSTVVVDDALSTTSVNPVENRVITAHVLGLESTVSGIDEALQIINGSQLSELNSIADDINGEVI